MQFIPENREDIIGYYKGTYVKFKEFGDQIFQISQVDSMSVKGTHESGEQFILWMNEETPYEMEYILPHKSFFQYGGDAVQLQRIPAKQYNRGLCGQNTQLSFLSSGGSLKHLELNFEVLKAFVAKQQWYTLQGAIGAQDKSTCALSSRMMYHRALRQIYIDFVPVAKVSPAKLLVQVTKPIFINEVQELLAGSGDKFQVVAYTPPPPKEKTKTKDLLNEMVKAAPVANLEW